MNHVHELVQINIVSLSELGFRPFALKSPPVFLNLYTLSIGLPNCLSDVCQTPKSHWSQ